MGEKKMDAAAEEFSAFTQAPELTKEEQLAADSYIESAAEQLQELKEAGYPVPEKKAAGLPRTDAFGGIEQGFTAPAELSPAEQLQADSYIESAAEQAKEIKELLNKE